MASLSNCAGQQNLDGARRWCFHNLSLELSTCQKSSETGVELKASSTYLFRTAPFLQTTFRQQLGYLESEHHCQHAMLDVF